MVSIGVKMVIRDTQVLLNQIGNAFKGCGLGDVDVTAHDDPNKN